MHLQGGRRGRVSKGYRQGGRAGAKIIGHRSCGSVTHRATAASKQARRRRGRVVLVGCTEGRYAAGAAAAAAGRQEGTAPHRRVQARKQVQTRAAATTHNPKTRAHTYNTPVRQHGHTHRRAQTRARAQTPATSTTDPVAPTTSPRPPARVAAALFSTPLATRGVAVGRAAPRHPPRPHHSSHVRAAHAARGPTAARGVGTPWYVQHHAGGVGEKKWGGRASRWAGRQGTLHQRQRQVQRVDRGRKQVNTETRQQGQRWAREHVWKGAQRLSLVGEKQRVSGSSVAWHPNRRADTQRRFAATRDCNSGGSSSDRVCDSCRGCRWQC